MPIETRFDIPFISSLALREKQIQQNYRPIMPWFAARASPRPDLKRTENP